MTSNSCWSFIKWVIKNVQEGARQVTMEGLQTIQDNKRRYKHPIRIIQFGEGNFLRAFWGRAIHEININGVFKGQIAVVQPIEQGKIDILREQGFLYNTSVQDEQTDELMLIESVKSGVNPYTDYDDYLHLAALPELKVVISNTTEAGIVLDAGDSIERRPPVSFPGKLLVFLYERYRCFFGDPSRGLLIFPCELIEQNGDILKRTLIELSRLNRLEEGFISWLTNANEFYNTLVDCIVTGFPHHEIEDYDIRLGYRDRLLVKAEPYRRLILQGNREKAASFPIETSSLDVVWSDDLRQYREIKVRIMNGFQTMLSHYGFFSGIITERDAVLDDIVGRNMVRGLFDIIIPSLPYPASQSTAFAKQMLVRLKNPAIEHVLMDINLNSFSKFQTRLLPDILYYREKGSLPTFLLFALALVLRYYSILTVSEGRCYGEFQGRRYQVFDNPDHLELLRRLRVDASDTGFVKRVVGESRLWRESFYLTQDEVERVGRLMKDIGAGNAIRIDLWESADTMIE